jgi:hypothetical protein
LCGAGDGCASNLYLEGVCGGRMRVRFVLGWCGVCVCVGGAAPRRGRARRAPRVARTPTLPPANNGARMPRVTGPMRTRNARRAAAASAGRGAPRPPRLPYCCPYPCPYCTLPPSLLCDGDAPRDCPATCPRTPTPTRASPRWRRAGPLRCSPAATRSPRSPRKSATLHSFARPRPGAGPRQMRPPPLPSPAPRCPWLPRGPPHPLRGMAGRSRPRRRRRSPPSPLRSRSR